MKLGEITKTIYSGQIISRVEAKEDVRDMVLEEKKVLIPKAISAGRVNHSDLGIVLSDRLFVSNLDKINCRKNKKKKAGTYDLHKLKFWIA